MNKESLQPNLLDNSIKVIKNKRKARNSSFRARCYTQLKNLVKVLEDVNNGIDDLSSIKLEIDKAKMLINEKEKT